MCDKPFPVCICTLQLGGGGEGLSKFSSLYLNIRGCRGMITFGDNITIPLCFVSWFPCLACMESNLIIKVNNKPIRISLQISHCTTLHFMCRMGGACAPVQGNIQPQYAKGIEKRDVHVHTSQVHNTACPPSMIPYIITSQSLNTVNGAFSSDH